MNNTELAQHIRAKLLIGELPLKSPFTTSGRTVS